MAEDYGPLESPLRGIMSMPGIPDGDEPAGLRRPRRHSCLAFLGALFDDVSTPASSPFQSLSPDLTYGGYQYQPIDDAAGGASETSEASYHPAFDEIEPLLRTDNYHAEDPFEGFLSAGSTIDHMIDTLAAHAAPSDNNYNASVEPVALPEGNLPADSTISQMLDDFTNPVLWQGGTIDPTYLDHAATAAHSANVESAISEESSDIFVDALTNVDDPITDSDHINSSPAISSLTRPVHSHHDDTTTAATAATALEDLTTTLSTVAQDVDELIGSALDAEARLKALSESLWMIRDETHASMDELSARLQGVADDTYDHFVEVRNEFLQLQKRVAEVEDVHRLLVGYRERQQQQAAEAEVGVRDDNSPANAAPPLFNAAREAPPENCNVAGKAVAGQGCHSHEAARGQQAEAVTSSVAVGAWSNLRSWMEVARESFQEERQRQQQRQSRRPSISSLVSVDSEIVELFPGAELASLGDGEHRAHRVQRRRSGGQLVAEDENKHELELELEPPRGGNSWGYAGAMLEAYFYAACIVAGVGVI
ncbi:hypothetical protein Micbo1qcDRAFT_180433 [Microdochium bolleyi]|uniref:Uncharacterized protein n=1 Tax=Microdochium bolleyi TaxID=196109 RepID=A0A136ILQ6_9PEZI|nr:hypothetical protein Micbo1qcDRAFT_180433 [Microdochium bolleyi]